MKCSKLSDQFANLIVSPSHPLRVCWSMCVRVSVCVCYVKNCLQQ